MRLVYATELSSSVVPHSLHFENRVEILFEPRDLPPGQSRGGSGAGRASAGAERRPKKSPAVKNMAPARAHRARARVPCENIVVNVAWVLSGYRLMAHSLNMLGSQGASGLH